jgi:GNAT superfamily N-acetyltransferase
MNLTFEKATINDVQAIVNLLLEDDLGKIREEMSDVIGPSYIKAFEQIDADPNQYLMVVRKDDETTPVATCHLTLMPSLTFKGALRMQIEAVRVAQKYRKQKIGKQMMEAVIAYGKLKGVTIFQLTTNKQRLEAKKFYEQLGFKATHEGMKMYL